MRRLLHPLAHHTWLWGHRLGLGLLFAAALLIGLARLFLPQLADYRPGIEAWLSEALGAPVAIGELHAGWHGWGPALAIRELRVRDPASGAVLVAFERAAIGLDPLATLRTHRPVIAALDLAGVRLHLATAPDGRLRLLPEAGGAPVPVDTVATWFAQVRRLDLRDGELYFADPSAPGREHAYTDFRLTLRGGADQRRAGLALRTPGDGAVQAAAVLAGPADAPADWHGQLWLRLDRLDLAALPIAPNPGAGRVDAELWGDWTGGALTRLLGRVDTDGLAPPPLADLPGLAPLLTGLPRLGARFDWQRAAAAAAAGEGAAAGWRAAVEYAAHDAAGARLHGGTLALARDAAGRLDATATDLPFDWLAALAAAQAGPAAADWLARLAPHARVPEAVVRVDPAQPGDWAAALRIVDAGLRADGPVPGFAQLDGTLRMTAAAGAFEFDAPGFSFDAAAVFRAPFFFDTARGRLAWTRSAGGWQIDIGRLELANPGIAAIAHGTVTLPADGGSPLLDLTAEVPRLLVAAAPTYLPDHEVGAGGTDWLDRGLVAGRGHDGRVRLRGRADGFPYRDGDGEFEARLRVEDAVLDFAPDWPPLEDLSAEVVFAGPRLDIRAAAARLLGVPLAAEVSIADLEHTVVEIDGSSAADGAELQRILRDTPVRARLGAFAEALTLAGPHRVELHLRIPTDGAAMDGRGRIHFLGATLGLPDAGWSFTDLHGALDFDDASLSADGIGLRFGDEPLRLDVASSGAAGHGETRFRLAGRYRPEILLGEAAEALLGPAGRDALASGAADGVLTLTVPATRSGAAQYTLAFDSPLAGLALRLPEPFGKRADEKRPLALKLEVGARERARLTASYGRELRALIELADFPQAPRIERGELRYGTGAPRLPADPGLRASVALAHYAPLAVTLGAAGGGRDEPPAGRPAPFAPPALPAWLKRVDARFGELELGGQRFEQVAASVIPDPGGGLRVDFDGPGLLGSVRVPAQPGPAAPLRVELQRLSLRRTPDEAAAAPAADGRRSPPPAGASGASGAPPSDPRGLPPLRIAVDDLRLDGRGLGRFTLNADPVPGGLAVPEGGLGLHGAGHGLDGHGDWLLTPVGPRTRLAFTLKSAAIGDTLAAFGYDPGIQRGQGTITAELGWPRSVDALELAVLEGWLHADIGEGQLLEVDPGVGRVLGLVSLTAIARRLTLDFRDFFGSGFAFDGIKARLRFGEGLSHTEHFRMEGPAASVEISGEADLRTREVAQHVLVTPRMGAALPIAGAIAGGPAGAAAAFVLDRVVGRGLDRIGRREYDIRGPWSAPRVEPASAPQAPETPAVPPPPPPPGR